jgi:hypothetical protein
MPACPNCGLPIDPLQSKAINREAYICGTDEAGRISQACATIKELIADLAWQQAENKRLGRLIEAYASGS